MTETQYWVIGSHPLTSYSYPKAIFSNTEDAKEWCKDEYDERWATWIHREGAFEAGEYDVLIIEVERHDMSNKQ